MARLPRDSVEYSMSWCPVCKYWVPSKYMHYDVSEEMGLIRICDNCLEGREVFKTHPHQYDPHREDVQCMYCDSYNTEPVEGEKDAWRCRDCGEVSYILP